MDEPEPFIRRARAPNESSYHTVHVPRETLVHPAKILEAWMEALESSDGEVSNSVNEKKLASRMKSMSSRVGKPKPRKAQFVTCAEVKALIYEEVKRSKACYKAPAWTEVVQDQLKDALQV